MDTGVLPYHKEFCTITPTPGTTCPTQNRRVDEISGANLAAHLSNNGLGLPAQCWDSSSFSPAASHGTAVASVAAGKTFGSAKAATIVDARAADCGGNFTTARVVAVLDWIPTDSRRGSRSVVNLSFSALNYNWAAPYSSAIKQSIGSLVNTYAINVVAAAGNFNDNVYWYTPASAGDAITVGGTNKANDARWAYSNYGNTTTLYAPAQHMESASTVVTELFSTVSTDWVRSELQLCDTYTDHCTSGTSFSAPLTAGVIARYLQSNPGASRSQVVSWLHTESANSTGVQVTEPDGRLVRLLNMSDCQ